jgi:hypothetical protein
MSTEYAQFLKSKAQFGEQSGFDPIWIPDCMFDFQQSVVEYNIRASRSADFLDCGMGKTLVESVWAENTVRKTNRPVLILTPLAVTRQFVSEGEKFGIEIIRTNGGSPTRTGIHVTNYEKLHLFDSNDWAGMVCDESSCIKAFDGKRRSQVTEFMRRMPYRLCATATAAPNDYIELGTTSETLGIMGQVDMLGRFFKNDKNTCDGRRMVRRSPAQGGPVSAGWRFKGHAEIPFWRFICSFSRSGRRPSDLGPFSDDREYKPGHRFILAPLIEREHIVETRTLADGYLIPLAAANRAEELEERRRTITERCEMAAELVMNTGKPFIIWCGLNPEGDLLQHLIPDGVQISGADSDDAKEEKYAAFLSGQSRGMISKQKIGGWGLNYQHCPHVVEFATHSFEQHYQGVRRCWRFGQQHPVTNDIIATEGQRGVLENMRRKSLAADRMFTALVKHMHQAMTIDGGYKFTQETEAPSWLM